MFILKNIMDSIATVPLHIKMCWHCKLLPRSCDWIWNDAVLSCRSGLFIYEDMCGKICMPNLFDMVFWNLPDRTQITPTSPPHIHTPTPITRLHYVPLYMYRVMLCFDWFSGDVHGTKFILISSWVSGSDLSIDPEVARNMRNFGLGGDS